LAQLPSRVGPGGSFDCCGALADSGDPMAISGRIRIFIKPIQISFFLTGIGPVARCRPILSRPIGI
jgi:hypothetical protein